MNSVYNLTVTDSVTSHFEKILAQQVNNDGFVIENAMNTMKNLNRTQLCSSVINHFSTLENMLTMLTDSRWNLSNHDKHYVLSALQYFSDEDDVIPDNIPVVGYLDDCIVIDLVAVKIRSELIAYNDFVKAAKIYASNDELYGVDEWSETKKKEVSSRMRHRRSRRVGANRRRSSGFKII
jgi:uncharacterized membrane protein YkvA (DUF1232 family)